MVKSIRRTDIARYDESHPLGSLRNYVVWGMRSGAGRTLDSDLTVHLPVHISQALRTENKHKESVLTPEMREVALRVKGFISLDSGRSFGTSREYTTTEGTPALKLDPVEALTADNGNEEGWPLPAGYGLAAVCVEAIARSLNERERYIHLRALDQPFEEIATYLGVTRERIRQIEGKALKKLRDPLIAKTFEGYTVPHDDFYYPSAILQPEVIDTTEQEKVQALKDALVEQLRHTTSRFNAYALTPQIVKQVVNNNFLYAQRRLNQGVRSDDIIDELI